MFVVPTYLAPKGMVTPMGSPGHSLTQSTMSTRKGTMSTHEGYASAGTMTSPSRRLATRRLRRASKPSPMWCAGTRATPAVAAMWRAGTRARQLSAAMWRAAVATHSAFAPDVRTHVLPLELAHCGCSRAVWDVSTNIRT